MGFMRRFDAGYASAKKQIEEGRIGMPLVFKSTSRDPFRPSLEYANPKSSGGMLLDMGIHDFDLARWFMGEVRTVSTIGATIAYPELATVGDIDNAVTSLTFASGKLGVVDLSRSGIYGYDISTEILGLEGTLKIGYLRETPVMLMTKNSVAHDTVPYFMERFRDAYTTQLQNFAQNVQQGRPAPITFEDGMEALRIGVAATPPDRASVVVLMIKPRSRRRNRETNRSRRSCGLGSRATCQRLIVNANPRSDVSRCSAGPHSPGEQACRWCPTMYPAICDATASTSSPQYTAVPERWSHISTDEARPATSCCAPISFRAPAGPARWPAGKCFGWPTFPACR